MSSSLWCPKAGNKRFWVATMSKLLFFYPGYTIAFLAGVAIPLTCLLYVVIPLSIFLWLVYCRIYHNFGMLCLQTALIVFAHRHRLYKSILRKMYRIHYLEKITVSLQTLSSVLFFATLKNESIKYGNILNLLH